MKRKRASQARGSFIEVGPSDDATTLEALLPELRPDQQEWINALTPDERETVDDCLRTSGAAYFLQNYNLFTDQLEYVRSL
jgi:hypothetical protein